MTRAEEIREAAFKYAAKEYRRCCDEDKAISRKDLIAGAEWADAHPKNPWRDAKTSKPKRTEVCDYDDWTSDVVYVMMENGYTSSAYYDHLGDEWRDYGTGYRIKEPTYWMPIPELLKGYEK